MGETLITDDGVGLWFRRIGEDGGRGDGNPEPGSTVGDQSLIIPGAVVDRDLEPLANAHRTVGFYDSRGRGRSETITDPARLGFHREVDDLDLVRAHFGVERTAALGWSYGAGVAAVWAMRNPSRATRLVLVSPIGPSWREESPQALEPHPGALARIDQLRAAGLPERDPVAFCEEWRRVYLPMQAAVPDVVDLMSGSPCECPNEWPDNAARAVAHVLVDLGRYDWRFAMRDLEVPVLVVVGDEDEAGAAAGEAWVLGLPDARGISLPGVGRFPWVESPGRFFAEVGGFLDES